MPQNAITVIKPYKWQGLWVFDDDRVDLVKEPFVAGADTWIDRAVELRGIEGADQGRGPDRSLCSYPHHPSQDRRRS
jgi:hypothetical protein